MKSLDTIKRGNELVTTTNSPNLIQYKDERKFNLTRIIKNKAVFNKFETSNTTNNNYTSNTLKTSENNSDAFMEFLSMFIKIPVLIIEFLFSNVNFNTKNYLLHDLKYIFNKKYRDMIKRHQSNKRMFKEI